MTSIRTAHFRVPSMADETSNTTDTVEFGVTTGAGGSFAEYFVRTYTATEEAVDRSNQYANHAMAWALAGKLITAELCAELADAYALLASQLGNAERLAYSMPRDYPPLLLASIKNPECVP